MNDSPLNIIATILAIGAAIQPLFLGAMFLFMYRLFPTRREIELMEENQKARHAENAARALGIDQRIAAMEENIMEILTRKRSGAL